MHIVRKSSFTPNPWKNGGGVTYEAMRVPAAGDPFRWRVSIARIDSSGPFSDFADYRRTLVLLHGDGVRLKLGGDDAVSLRQAGDCVEFDGAVPTHCELLGGPCSDLNLMVSKSRIRACTRVQALEEPRRVRPSKAQIVLFLAIGGSLVVESGVAAAVTLEPWDLAVLCGDEEAQLRPAADQTPAPLVFFATLDDNSL